MTVDAALFQTSPYVILPSDADPQPDADDLEFSHMGYDGARWVDKDGKLWKWIRFRWELVGSTEKRRM
jgi:hypothetical protein